MHQYKNRTGTVAQKSILFRRNGWHYLNACIDVLHGAVMPVLKVYNLEQDVEHGLWYDLKKKNIDGNFPGLFELNPGLLYLQHIGDPLDQLRRVSFGDVDKHGGLRLALAGTEGGTIDGVRDLQCKNMGNQSSSFHASFFFVDNACHY